MPVTCAPALADGPFSLKDTITDVEAPSWSGIYFGVGGGFGYDHSKDNYADTTGVSSSNDEFANGGLISLIYGIDRQIGDRFVIGAFADVSISDLERGDDSIHNALTIDRSWAVGGRAGYLVTDRTMIYATAGYTQAHFDNDGWWDIDVNGTGTTLPGRRGATFDGYFVGGGIETRLNGNFFLRGEARYSDFSGIATNAGSFAGTDFVDREAPSITSVEAALIYKLDRSDTTEREPVDENHGPKVISYSGVDVANHAVDAYTGTIFGLSGDLYKSGFLLRTEGIIADYSFHNIAPPQTKIDANDRSLDIMPGYQWVFPHWSAIGYVGYEVRDIRLSPDDLNSDLRGTKDGFKVAAEFETDEADALYASLEGSYSTAFDSYYGQARMGYNMKRLIIGPESAVYGDESDWAARVGAFATIPFQLTPNIPAKITFNAGQQFVNKGDSVSRAGGEGAYGESMLRVDF